MRYEEQMPVVPIRPSCGKETILLAEDDENVREVISVVLKTSGYTVINAVNGEDAVQIFMSNKDKINILLLDIVMPIKSGKEAYEEIKKITPDIKVLFMSGYPPDVIYRREICEQGLDVLSKPIPPHKLLIKLREALDKEGDIA